MAAYALTYAPRLGKMLDTTPPVVWHVPIEASQGFSAGEFLVRTSGYAVAYASAGTKIFGVAKEDAPSAAGEVEVLVCTAMTGIRIPVHDVTASNSDIEADDHGNATYDLNKVTNPYWYVDKATSGAAVTIQQFISAVGTVNGHVIITVNYDTREVG